MESQLPAHCDDLAHPSPGVEVFEFLTALGKVVAAGHNCVNFDVLYGYAGKYSGPLPAYPFAPKALPWFVASPEIARQRQHRNGPLNYPQLQVNVRTHPGLADHVIKGEPIMPASGFIEMALEYGASELYDVKFHGLLALSAERPVPVQVKLDGTRWSVSSATSTDYTTAWPIQYNRLHADGYLSMAPVRDRGVAPLDLDAIRQRLKPISMKGIYSALASFANYGPMYRRLRRCYMATVNGGGVEVLTEIRGMDKDIPNCSDYRVHPAILDAAIHIQVHPAITGNYDPNYYHLPSGIAAFRLCPGFEGRPFPATVFAHATFVSWTPETLTYNHTIVDDRGIPIFVIEGLTVALHGYRLKPLERRYDVVYRPTDISLAAYREGFTNGHAQPNGDSKSGNGHADPDTEGAPSLVIIYFRGREMQIKEQISKYDSLQSLNLLFVAEDGLDGDAAQGFTRSLRKEFSAWTVRLATFDASWTEAQRKAAAKRLLSLTSDEFEFRVDAVGAVSAPRVELAPPPAAQVSFDVTRPWKMEKGRASHISIGRSSEDDVVVNVERVASSRGDHWAYIGRVQDVSDLVVGISSGPVSSHLVVHRRALAECNPHAFFTGGDALGPPILAASIVALTVGVKAFSDAERLHGKRALLVEADEDLRSQVANVLSALGLDVLSGPSTTEINLESLYQRKPTFVLSGTRDAHDIGVLRTVLAPHGRLFLWNHAEEGLAAISAHDPWAIRDVLRAAVLFRGESQTQYVSPPDLLATLPSTVAPSPDLFDPNKSYLLIGGIGSLGLHMALWMYEKGARNIILTSRYGAESLERRGDYIAQRILTYLQSRTDVDIQTVAVDASSKEGMEALVKGLAKPLGGCVLLAVLLVDRMFSSHTQDTFEASFIPKIQGFLALEQTVKLDTLDFLVTFSSTSGVFGNPGQTNYAAANSALAGLTRKYKNAFSIISPMILDSGVMTLSDDSYNARVRHLLKWGMTARELCDCIGDGIRKLQDGGVWQYIPDLDWKTVRENIGPSPMYDHLVPADAVASEEPAVDKNTSLTQTVCRVLDLNAEEISIDVPLTTYGLDSLSAAALSFALRPLLAVSQVQLLADLTIKDLLTRMEKSVAIPTGNVPVALTT